MLAVISALALGGCGGNVEEERPEEEADQSRQLPLETEDESELPTFSGDAATDDAAYLKLLGLTRGRLIAFYELYTGGARELAQTHVMHPQAELHNDLAKAFAARGKPGFAPALNSFVDAAAAGGDVHEDYSAFIETMSAYEPVTAPAVQLLAISQIVRAAAEAFDIGVDDDGSINHAHDYLDAYGYLVAARDMLAGIETHDVGASDAISLAHEQIELALGSFDGLTAETTEGQAATLFEAAARIETAAHGLI